MCFVYFDTDSPPDETIMRDQRVWSVRDCADVFRQSVAELQQRLNSNIAASDENAGSAMLVWDKVTSERCLLEILNADDANTSSLLSS
jgi:hypothetical protein